MIFHVVGVPRGQIFSSKICNLWYLFSFFKAQNTQIDILTHEKHHSSKNYQKKKNYHHLHFGKNLAHSHHLDLRQQQPEQLPLRLFDCAVDLYLIIGGSGVMIMRNTAYCFYSADMKTYKNLIFFFKQLTCKTEISAALSYGRDTLMRCFAFFSFVNTSTSFLTKKALSLVTRRRFETNCPTSTSSSDDFSWSEWDSDISRISLESRFLALSNES